MAPTPYNRDKRKRSHRDLAPRQYRSSPKGAKTADFTATVSGTGCGSQSVRFAAGAPAAHACKAKNMGPIVKVGDSRPRQRVALTMGVRARLFARHVSKPRGRKASRLWRGTANRPTADYARRKTLKRGKAHQPPRSASSTNRIGDGRFSKGGQLWQERGRRSNRRLNT